MEQLIELIDIRYIDNSNLQPAQTPLNERVIINSPENVDAGYLTLDTTSLIQIDDVNFIYLVTRDSSKFNITIINDNGQLEMQASQFVYQNPDSNISLILSNPNTSSIRLNKLICNYTLV